MNGDNQNKKTVLPQIINVQYHRIGHFVKDSTITNDGLSITNSQTKTNCHWPKS